MNLPKESDLAMLCRIVFCLVVVCWLAETARCQTPVSLTAEQWREDLRFVARSISQSHKNAYHQIDKATLDTAFGELESRIDEMEPYEIVLETMRIVALVGDGHTQFRAWGSGLLRLYPIEIELFSDGIFVVGASVEHAELIGAKVERVGSGDAESVMNAVFPFVPGDNEWTRRGWFPRSFVMAELLHRLDFVADMNAAKWEFVSASGERIVKTMEPISMSDYNAGVKRPEMIDAELPLYRRESNRNYWIKHFPDEACVYMRFNAVGNEEGKHLAAFSRELIAFIDQTRSDFLVIDIRDNGGGNGDLLTPLIRRIADHARINREGHLYVITNRIAFSAAMMFVTRVERNTNVIFAGEPAGGKPNHYGDALDYKLPNSGSVLRLSSLYHEESAPADTRPFQEVQIEVSVAAADYFANRDPVLDAVLEAIREVRSGAGATSP